VNGPLIYPFGLREVGIVVGALLLLGHLFAIWRGADCRKWLREFPRSFPAGLVLLVAAGVWSLWLVRTMDLGEFAPARGALTIGVVAATVLSAQFMREFLAVRALGMLLMLAAEPVLGAAFLRPEASRLLLVVLAYGWIVAGLFWVGMPYLFRDQINWVVGNARRFQAAAIAGAAYGAAILAAALTWK